MNQDDLDRRVAGALKARADLSPAPPVFGGVRHRVASRRRRHRAAASLLAVVLIAVGAAAWLARDGADPSRPHVRVPPAQTSDDPVNPDRVDLLMFAQVGYLSDTAILDLASGRTHHYAGMEQALGNGSISGALVTTDCLVLWQAGAISPSTARTLSFKVPLGTSTAPDLSADASIGLGSILGERRVVATEDGARVWIEAFGSSVLSPPDEAGRLEYVDCTSGDVLGTVQLGAQPGARSSFLFGAVGDQAVVVQNGGDVDERVLLVAPSGETTPLPSPSPARFIAAGAGRVLWSTPDGELLVTDATGQLLSTIASPVAGSQWLTAAAPIRDSPHQRTISLDGTRALVRLADLERDDGAHALYLVDFATGRAQRLDLGPGQPNSAVWSRDDTRIVGIVTSLSPTLIVQLDAATGTRLGAPRALPPQYFILGAG